MKICIASWAPFVAGAEVAAERLALGLQAAGHDVVVALGTDGAALERMRAAGLDCRFVPVRFTGKLTWLAYRSARQAWGRLLAGERLDVVHANDLPTGQIVCDAARRLGIPRVCHHRWIFEGPAIDWLNKYDADRHLFVSRALMDDLCSKSPKLASRPRTVVYDGLPLPEAPSRQQRIETRRKLLENGDEARGLRIEEGVARGGSSFSTQHSPLTPSAGRPVVTFAGQIIERKGVAEVVRAWAQLGHWHEKADLLIIGDDLENDGAYRRQMEALAAELACPARFLGFQKNVGEWLTASDIVLVPSHAEPLGNATLEAMSYGLPVVGGNVGGIPEMVVDGETGVLVPPRNPDALAQSIDRLLADEDLRLRLGAAARRRCEELFSLEAHVEAVVEQYRLAIESRGTGSSLTGRSAADRKIEDRKMAIGAE